MGKFINYGIGFLLLVLCSCNNGGELRPAFYHWRTRLEPSSTELNAMASLDAQRLYVKYFDVDIDEAGGTPRPMAQLQYDGQLPDSMEVVPCIFITNRSLKALSPSQTDTLAANIFRKIMQLHAQFKKHPLQEVQIDCDWTPSTQKAYFRLLDQIREPLHAQKIQISCTIRLHQFKFAEKTGVPDVDRGMLMVYNLGNLDDPGEENSIFKLKTVRDYVLPKREYPLELDVALPIFAWSVLIRQGKPIRLLNNLRFEGMAGKENLQITALNRVEVTESHYFYKHYLYKGDKIRCESVSSIELLEAAKLLSEVLPEAETRHLAFYHLDTLTLKHYTIDTLQTVIHLFN